MPSIYRQDSRSDPYDASMRNFAKARARWRPPRPWRSSEESRMVEHFVFYWHTCRDRSNEQRSPLLASADSGDHELSLARVFVGALWRHP